MHDFNPGITTNGVFWIVQVAEDAVQITEDSLTINLRDASVVDQGQFPGGTGAAPVTLSYVATYTKSGMARTVRPRSHDPLSPFNWAGKMWTATNSGHFSLAYNDGTFSASGSFDSSGNFGEMGTERNGSFAATEDSGTRAEANALPPAVEHIEKPVMNANGNATKGWNARLKGRVPIAELLSKSSPIAGP